MTDGVTSFVIFGASGDLSRERLLPSLFALHQKGRLSNSVKVIGSSRTPMSDDQFRELAWAAVQKAEDTAASKSKWAAFARKVFYVQGDVTALEDCRRLKERLEEMEGGSRPANRLFYLSIAPQLYEPAVKNLGVSGLAVEDGGWRRVVIEKPFGWDRASAEALNQAVHRVFRESQVYRIDHYLGKETVQNLLALRFANSIFEPVWNRNYVDNVEITVAESVGVGSRAGYYDRSGVVRDMVQNHLLQLLTMVAMEPPANANAASLRNSKVDVLRAIRRWGPEEAARNAVKGQYRGYREEPGVAAGSKTPTYVAMRMYVDNWRWQGVPFYLRTGKAMAKKVTEVVVEFQRPPHLMFSLPPGESLMPNILAIFIQPDEGAHLRFQAKVPGEGMTMFPVDMEFHYKTAFGMQAIPEAYERLLQDTLNGDASLFIRSDHIEEAWSIVDPLVEAWEDPSSPAPHIYKRGSWGPAAADALVARDGRAWLEHEVAHAVTARPTVG